MTLGKETKLIAVLAIASVLVGLLLVQTSQQAAQAQNIISNRDIYTAKTATQTSARNGTNILYVPTINKDQGTVIVRNDQGNLANENIAVSGSINNSTWFVLDNRTAGTTSTYVRSFSAGNLSTTIDVNPVTFPYLRITVPSMGTDNQSSTVTVTLK